MQSSKSLLIIEDDPDLRMTLEYFLGRIGYEVLTAKNGEEGLKQVYSERPQAVLCDIQLPGSNGYDICTKIKGDPVTASTVVVFISARPSQELLDKGANASADFYINKPVDPNDVGADLYMLFDKEFDFTEEEARDLRVTKKIPNLHESLKPGYVHQDPNAIHIEPPERVKEDPYGHPPDPHAPRPAPRKKAEPAPVEPDPTSTAPTSAGHRDAPVAPVAPAAAPPPSESKTGARTELREIHDLLESLKNSLKDTGQRLDAILQYIDVIDH